MSVELFRITDADVLRAKDVWESQCGMVELIGPQMATFHYHSVSPFFVAKFEWLNLAGRPIFTPRSRDVQRGVMWRKRVQPPGRPALRSLFSLPLLIL